MDMMRTPEDRFDDLPDYPFPPHYTEVRAPDSPPLRMHYVDEGPHGGSVVLCLHGEPTWSYLYRHMIPVFTKAGHRVIAPDLVGFGKSDKPARREDYSYARHVAWMTGFVRGIDLTGITLVCQDWGGLIGLRLLAAMPDRFDRVVISNTALPTGDHPMGPAFEAWREYSQTVEEFRAGRIVYGGTVSRITEAEQAAYDAPFPDASYQAGARVFPVLVPDSPDNPESEANRQAWEVLCRLEHPVLTAFGAEDRIMAGVDKLFQRRMKGARGQPHVTLPGAGHFLQEDVGPELARLVCDFIAAG